MEEVAKLTTSIPSFRSPKVELHQKVGGVAQDENVGSAQMDGHASAKSKLTAKPFLFPVSDPPIFTL